MLAPEIFAYSFDQFFRRQFSFRLYNGSLAVYPMRLNRIEPRAFYRQSQDEYSYSTFSLYFLIVLLDPTPHRLALVPGRIVPDQRQHPFAFFSQLLNYPLQEIGRHLANGSPLDKSQHQLVGVASQQPIAAQGQRVRIGFALFKLMQFQHLGVSPGMQSRLMKPAPPSLIFITQHPILVRRSKPVQPVKLLFFNAYCGSGLVIQFFARFHFTPRRLIALRITSRLTGWLTSPCSKTTSAANSKVQRLVGLEKWRGEACSRAFSRSHFASSRMGCTVFGRRDFSSTEARPKVWKARITLRTVWVAQPKAKAIFNTRSPRALESRIWQRRTLKALRERSPDSRCFCSSGVKDRTNIGGFMLPMISQNCSYTKSFMFLH